MTKPSFFDKLTGSLKVAEEAQIPASQMQAQAPTQESAVETEPAFRPKIEAEMQPLAKKESGWHSEVEGQLTVDVFQNPNEIVIKSTIAGVTIDDLDISITNDMVTIRGERKKDEDVPAEDYFYQECYWGAFSRSIILPVDIEAEKAVAVFKNGILTIRLPKIEKVRTRKIKIMG